MKWRHFSFFSGSNPYISTTDSEFWRMLKRYQLFFSGENMFNASRRLNPPRTREEKKEILRDFAADWQSAFSLYSPSYLDIADWQSFFAMYGRKYGLLREFRENGVL